MTQPSTHPSPLSLSIIIPNYNYERFIAAAIESALAVVCPHFEVIVVDDGSTDASLNIIKRYADRVTVIAQQNGGQLSACNTGFAKSNGDLIIFLDSDDMLDPSVMNEIVAVWEDGISKIQFQMKTIDAEGKSLGGVLPQYHIVPTPEEVRQWVSTTSAYPTPPGSGNVYTRSFLEKIFPLTDRCGSFSDSCCLAAAPYLGKVITIAKPLVSYRIHGKNDGAFSTLDRSRFAREVTRAQARFAYAQSVARSAGFEVPNRAGHLSLSALPYRLASYRLSPETHPIAGDSLLRILGDVLTAVTLPQGISLRGRLTLLIWAMLVASTPAAIHEKLILWRFAAVSRPAFLKKMLSLTGVLRARVAHT